MGQFLRGFKKGINEFELAIQSLVNIILLSFVYFFGVGLSFFLSKILGKTLIKKDILFDEKSYWDDLNLKSGEKEKYYRQF